MIGRGNDPDIKISDISVSRLHAILRINDDNTLVLEDNSSKFGTLALCKTPTLIPKSSKHLYGFQIG